MSPFSLAVVAAGQEDRDRTMEWLEVGYREKANLLVWIKVDPRFDFLRTDPRYVDLVKRMRLD